MFREKLETDLVLLDGAFGTYAQSIGLKDEYFEDRPGCMEYLSITRPDFVKGIHSAYLEAGADAVETNTFGANAVKLMEYGLSDKVYEINLVSTKLARSAADKFSAGQAVRYVMGSMGPTGKLPSSSDAALGNISYGELKKIYCEQALAIIDGGADAFLIETGQDLLEMKAALNGAKEAMKKKKKDLVLMTQCTLTNNGRMLLGTEVSAFMATLAYLGADVIGINCGTGPLEMESSIRFLSENSPTFISCVPNAGLPIERNGKTEYPLKPDEMARILSSFVHKYRLDVVGGCCGTTPDHISGIRKCLRKEKKRRRLSNTFCSGFYNGFDLKEKARPIKVGERINAQGSRKMKELLKAENFDGIIELGKKEEREGADILDVCAILSERSTETRDSVILTKRLAESVRSPLMIDSTSVDVIKAALENYPGTLFINSVNLEDGGVKAKKVFALAKEHGAFTVILTIDEKGMAKTPEQKCEIADKLRKMAVEEFGLDEGRLIFDMLTFTLATGAKEYSGAAIDTYSAIKDFKKRYPHVLTSLGVSNISFGLAKPARKVLNMAFLHHASLAGLDMAIINPEEFIEYRDIPAKARALAENLIFNKNENALSEFIEYFAGEKAKVSAAPVEEKALTIEEKLKRCVILRDKADIIPLVDEAVKEIPPERIINDVLMDAMRQVGEKLETGEMVLPFVLQSAEVIRTAIEHLGKFMPHEGAVKKGKILLATVFGDVHDIGKNLVKMLLENNGFSVIDLGKQVPVERIVEEAVRNDVDAVGLSALLVSTARHMKLCVQSMHDAGLDYPILIGGAPLNKEFAKNASLLQNESVYKGGVFYAKDAFTGLKIMRALMDAEKKKETLEAYYKQFEEAAVKTVQSKDEVQQTTIHARPSAKKKPTPPFYGIRALSNISVDDVFSYLDEDAVFRLAWGSALKDEKEKKRLIKKEYKPLLNGLKEEAVRRSWLDLKAVYGYFKCRVRDEDMEVFDDFGNLLEKIHFSRSRDSKRMSLADYFSKDEEGYDVVAFQAVTIGAKISSAITELTAVKEYTRAFLLHGLSVYLAEALAAYVHDRIRSELFLKKDEGKRYSPGYPLWGNLEDQKKIFKLLDVEARLHIYLTDEYLMVPEQSTTAMVVYNDRAEY